MCPPCPQIYRIHGQDSGLIVNRNKLRLFLISFLHYHGENMIKYKLSHPTYSNFSLFSYAARRRLHGQKTFTRHYTAVCIPGHCLCSFSVVIDRLIVECCDRRPREYGENGAKVGVVRIKIARISRTPTRMFVLSGRLRIKNVYTQSYGRVS